MPVQPRNTRQRLIDFEPTAARLVDRHLRITEEWLPHEYSQGRDFDKQPWTLTSLALAASLVRPSRSTSCDERPALDSLRGVADVGPSEKATRVPPTAAPGQYSKDRLADRIVARVWADEDLHATF